MAKQQRLKIATFNLENLQLAGNKTYYNNVVEQKVYDKKVVWSVSKLQELNADIIGFQELWHPDALEDVFNKAGMLNDYKLISKLYPNRVAVALAVKKEIGIVNRKWIEDMPDELVLRKKKKTNEPESDISVNIKKFSRPVLRVNIKPVKGPNIVLFVAHLKSKRPMRLDSADENKPAVKTHKTALGSALSTIRRTAEAAAFRILLTKTLKGTHTAGIAIGDMNDYQTSTTTSIITQNPGYRLYHRSRTGYKSDVGLYSVAMLQELRSLRDVYYTYIYKGFRESLDHILVSEQFYDYSVNRIWSFEESRIINDHLDNQLEHESDHGIVCSTFIYHPYNK